QECGPWMLADVVGAAWVGSVEDVRIAVRCAGRVCELRCGLVVAESHAEPERGMQLEVPGAGGAALVRQYLRVARQLELIQVRVPRARRVRVEQQRGLIVPGVLPRVSDRVRRLRAQGRRLVALGNCRARRATEHAEQNEQG